MKNNFNVWNNHCEKIFKIKNIEFFIIKLIFKTKMKTLLDQEKSKVYLIQNILTKELQLELIEFLKKVKFTHDIFKFGSKEINSPRKTQSFCFEENLNYNFNQKFKSSTFIKDQNHILKKITNHLKSLNQSNNYDANKIIYVLINHYIN